MEGGRRAEPLLWAEAAAKLAELRLAQGRIGDAEQLVAGLEDQPVATYARAALSLVRAAPTATASSVRRRLGAADVQASERARLLDLLVQAHVAARDDPALADEVEALAATPNVDGGVVAAYQARAIGRGRAALGDGAAADDLEKALAGFGSVGMPYEAGRTRLLLATLLAGRDDQTAIADARSALACFDQLGATRDADAAAALLRSLGVRSPRAGRRVDALLSRREHDVLQLLSEGLANRDIADRLYISPKTVEHHVASILGKLGLRRRAEAAAYALRHLEDGPAARRE
jgi:DNA-binding CsgD family transcriptional regulator